MALVTVQRSPTPSTTSSPCASVSPSGRQLLASVTAAPLCLSGSRRTPLRTRRASSQALALRLPRTSPLPNTHPHPAGERQRRPDVGLGVPITRDAQPLTALARKSPVACFPWLEHFLSAMSHSCFSPSPFFYPLLLDCREGNGGLPHYPRPTPMSHHLGTRSVHCASFFRLTVCVPSTRLWRLSLSSLVLRTVQASLGCSMVVTPWFLPSLKRWQWSTLKMAVVYSASWTFTFFSQVPKHPVLLDDQCQFISILQTLNALRSLLMMVLALGLCLDGSLLQMLVSLKAVSRRKMPGNQLFFFFSCRASLCLHPHPNSFTVLSLGFIFESTC